MRQVQFPRPVPYMGAAAWAKVLVFNQGVSGAIPLLGLYRPALYFAGAGHRPARGVGGDCGRPDALIGPYGGTRTFGLGVGPGDLTGPGRCGHCWLGAENVGEGLVPALHVYKKPPVFFVGAGPLTRPAALPTLCRFVLLCNLLRRSRPMCRPGSAAMFAGFRAGLERSAWASVRRQSRQRLPHRSYGGREKISDKGRLRWLGGTAARLCAVLWADEEICRARGCWCRPVWASARLL